MDSSRDIVRRLREARILNERNEYSQMDRNKLIELAQSGDQLAADTLLKGHTDFINKCINKYFLNSGSGYDRDDIFQLASIAFWNAVMSWDMRGDFEAYAGMLIKRKMTDEIRKINTDRSYANSVTTSMDAADSADDDTASSMNSNEFSSWVDMQTKSAEEEAIEKDSMIRLVNYMKDTLTDQEMQVLKLYVDGYKMAKISEVTGMKYKACENALRRAKGKLLEYMNNVRESKQINESDDLFSEEEKTMLRRAFKHMEESKKVDTE